MRSNAPKLIVAGIALGTMLVAFSLFEMSGNEPSQGALGFQAGGGFQQAAGLAQVETASPISGTGSAGSAVSLATCASGQVYEMSSGTWTCTTPSGGATIASTTALIKGDGAGNGVAYAGSTPGACTAGQMDTGPALSNAGVLTQTCTQELPASASGSLLMGSSSGSASASSISDNGTTVSTAEALSVGNIAGSGSMVLTGITASSSTGTLDNIALGSASIWRWTGTSTTNVDGFSGGTNGQLLFVIAAGATNSQLILVNEAAGSTAANRIWTQNLSSIALTPNSGTGGNSGALLVYDGTSSRWRVVAYQSVNENAAFTYNNSLVVATGTLNTTFGTTTTISSGTAANAINIGTSNTGGITLGQSTNPTTVVGLGIVDGHLEGSGTAIGSITSCGTGSPAAATGSTDKSGKITEGTSAAGCTVAFAGTYTNSPFCLCTANAGGTAVACDASGSTATSLVIVNASATGDVITYWCTGRTGGT